MEEEETKAPCRVRLVFADRHLLSKEQRSEGLRRSLVVIRPDLKTVAEFCRDITSRFGLSTTSSHGLLLWVGISKLLPSTKAHLLDFVVVQKESMCMELAQEMVRISPYQTIRYLAKPDSCPQGDGTRTKGTSWKPKSRFNGPNAHNRNWQPCRDSSGRNAINSQLRIGNNFTTAETAEKIIPRGEEINEDKLDFESLYPLPNLPREGDIIAYRLDIIDSLGCPGLSSFRVGRVIVFDPVLMIIFLLPVPEYPTPDCEMSEFEKSMYKEDGSLEIDFESVVDLRLVKEGQVKTAPKMHKSGKGNKSKASSWQDGAENSLSLLGRNDNNVNSAWEVGEASNAKEATESDWGASVPSTSRDGASWPSAGQYATGFGSHGDLSRGWNNNVSNGNSNSAWEANGEAANANESTPPQQNGWGAWEPSTSRAGASWQHMGQHGSGFGSRGGYSRRGRRRGSGGK
ncbi:hypothetical protein FCM35_KLT00192 [Carex littledalei]|uniref:Coilin tudor domain-containing protein n=1 Tax=Carex littledalei TaxID=544730 RepID=A0A833S128_9POAL|nr:hypothetical protein FCM35_KLT00192 [Carex littledalei]